MSRKRILLTRVVVLVVINLIAMVIMVLVIRASRTNRLWKISMDGIARYAAVGQALDDYKAGKLRLYELTKDGEHKFTDRHDGPFEIWYRPYYSSLGHPGQYTQEVFVDAYNSKMWYMYEHPERFKPHPDDPVAGK